MSERAEMDPRLPDYHLTKHSQNGTPHRSVIAFALCTAKAAPETQLTGIITKFSSRENIRIAVGHVLI